MSDNQHKIKTAKNYDEMFTYIFIQKYTLQKTQLHNYEYSYLFINKQFLYLYLKFCRVLQHFKLSSNLFQLLAPIDNNT